MGCCCSKKGEELQQVSKNARRDPPPPPPEEEMVKEVLSETPKPKPKPLAPRAALNKLDQNELKSKRPDSEAPAPLPESEKKTKSIPPLLDDRSEQPQPSDEACSLSEAATSISSSMGMGVAMAMATREREEWDTSSSLPNNKIPNSKRSNSNCNGNISTSSRRSSQLQSYSGELGGGGGVRKERLSPAVVVSGVGCRSGRASPALPPRSNNSRSLSGDRSGVKRDIGERSARRSVSPGAKRRELAGPNKSGPLAKRIPPAPLNKAALGTEEGGQEGKESLDNPSVSLECFIFL